MKALLLEPESWEDTRMRDDEQDQRLLGEMRSDIRHLQSDVTDIKADHRIRFDRIDERFDQVDARLDKMDERFDRVDARLDKMDERFDQVDARLDKMDERFDRVDERLDKMDERFDERFDNADARFGSIEKNVADLRVSLESAKVWAIGLYVAFAGTMLAVMARGFKWI